MTLNYNELIEINFALGFDYYQNQLVSLDISRVGGRLHSIVISARQVNDEPVVKFIPILRNENQSRNKGCRVPIDDPLF